MTSAHSMFARDRRFRAALSALFVLTLAHLCACHGEKLHTPVSLTSPYERPLLWAVVPFNNESGVSIVKADRVADVFVEQAEDIDGIATAPVNRVLAAMRRIDMRSIATHQDAVTLMNVLGVDGLIVGTVTAYDPYPPLKFGAAVQLYRREAGPPVSVDPYRMTRSTNDAHAAAPPPIQPVAQASGVFDASNHQVLKWLDEFAAGRNEPGSAYGKRIYLASMEMYTQFVAYRLLHDLLLVERARLQPAAAPVK